MKEDVQKRKIDTLIDEAFLAQEYSYSPYSNFMVGAALLTASGMVYRGCNIENAAYSPGNCAERTAVFKAVSEGETRFLAIAIVGNKKGVPKGEGQVCAPCGVCRQVLAEFCDPKTFRIILGVDREHYEEYTLEELLPLGFGKGNLK